MKINKSFTQQAIIFVCFVLYILGGAKIMQLVESTQILQYELLEHKKALSLHKQFMTDIQSYIANKYKTDTDLFATFENFTDYMQTYSTPQQKGKSSKFMQEIRQNLEAQLQDLQDYQYAIN